MQHVEGIQSSLKTVGITPAEQKEFDDANALLKHLKQPTATISVASKAETAAKDILKRHHCEEEATGSSFEEN